MCQRGPGSSCTARWCCLSSFTTVRLGEYPKQSFSDWTVFTADSSETWWEYYIQTELRMMICIPDFGSQPLSELVAKRRRSLTAHVLRMSEQSPPCLAMSCYFQAGSRGRRGRPAATLPTIIIMDLAGHDIPLKNASDLEGARAFAADKSKWRSDIVYG